MTAVLLDTHALIWFAAGNTERMPQATAELIADPAHEVVVSAASIWEISTKTRFGKLHGAQDIAARPEHYISGLGMTGLSIRFDHAARAALFEAPHSDPFDRMLAAQSQIETLPLVSLDDALDQFGIERIWPV